MTEEEIESAPVHFTVSNVIEETDGLFENVDAQLIVQSPTVITSSMTAAMFYVYQLTEVEEGNFESELMTGLPISGPISIYFHDPTAEPDETGYIPYVDKIVDASEMDKYEGIEMIYYIEGSAVTITEPGDYFVILREEAVDGSASAFIKVVDNEVGTEKPVEKVKAESTKSRVLVNGQDINFDAYKINNNNYFKLRDLAKVLSGTEKQFEA
ncbi:MAG TPA: hypothetical protein GXX70_04580 [Tepidimicrobium sp.]|nr:hypothetical protein [Tepidimicrobium sp.]